MDNINKKVNEFKESLDIKNNYVNLFDYITRKKNYIEKYNMILFKKDLEESSGFIGYVDNYALICINSQRNIGHQNFTLAHEFGHLILHKGQHFNDSDDMFYNSNDAIEEEANQFARELLYPESLAHKNYNFIIKNNLLNNLIQLSDFINEIATTHFISHSFAFYRTLIVGGYKGNRKYLYRSLKNEVGNLGDRYDAIFYNVNKNHDYYKDFNGGIEYIEALAKKLLQKSYISPHTAESIISRNKEI